MSADSVVLGRAKASTGDDTLDDLLNGGLPRNRAVLLFGGPGTGKSTLAMQYLQAGLDNDEDCLYVTTEQTADELRDSFAHFSFDLDHDNLTIASIHATPGQTLEGEEELTLSTLGEDHIIGEEFSAPFSAQYIQQYLERFDDADRVVLDSVSGLAPLAEGANRFRRDVLELIRLFTDDFGATTLFTSEETEHTVGDVAASDLLQFTTHGSIRLWQETVRGDYHRYVRVRKMRGVDHDTRRHEFEITSNGVTVVPRQARRVASDRVQATGLAGLDDLCGGGLPKGHSTVLEHDGRARVDPITASIATSILQDGGTVALFMPATLGREWVEESIANRVSSLQELLDQDRLFVLDWFNDWDMDHRNIFTIHRNDAVELLAQSKLYLLWRLLRTYQKIDERRGDRMILPLIYTETALQDFSPRILRFQHNWSQANILEDRDVTLFVQNPGTMDDQLAEFYVYDASMVLETWRNDSGMQYIRLDKGTHGVTGVSRLVKQQAELPFLEIQQE